MMERLFQHPTWLKVLSLIGAILLWVMVMPQYFDRIPRTFDVQLQIIPHPTWDVVDGLPATGTTVQVKVEGKALVVNKLRREDFSALVDYRKVPEPGKPAQVEVQVSGPKDKRLEVTSIPKIVQVTLVEQQEAEIGVAVVPVSDVISQNNVDWLFRATPALAKVRIRGRNDVLKTVAFARIDLDPKELVPNSTRTIRKLARPVDAAGKPVALDAQTVDVAIDWQQLPPGKRVKVQSSTKGTLAPGLAVISVEPEVPTVTLRAANVNDPSPTVESITTEPVDITGKTKPFVATVRLLPPPGTTASVETINVRVRIEEIPAERDFKGVPIQVQGKASNAEVVLTVTDVTVVVKGPHATINALESTQVRAYVDVEGMRPGRHLVPVKVNGLPAGASVLTDPPVVEVIIVVQ